MATITVTNSAQLSSALSTAHGGDTILLAPGSYGDLKLSNKVFDGPVTITSLDPNQEADFRTVFLNTVTNLHFKSVAIGYALAPGEPSFAKMTNVSKSSYISFDDVHFRGSLDGNPGNDGNGLSVDNSNHIRVLNSTFEQLNRATMIGSSTDVEVLNNVFHDLRSDGADFADIQRGTISGNRFYDFYPAAGDHPDAIQFWTTGTTKPSTDILISDNVIMQGNGAGLQGIFLSDKANTLPFDRVTITNNLVYVADGYNGLAVFSAQNVVVQNNTVLSPKGDATSIYIRMEDINNLVLKDNVSDTIINDRNTNVMLINNLRLDQSPTRATDFRDLNARALADPLGLEIDGKGYQSEGAPAPLHYPRIGTSGADLLYMGATMNGLDVVDGREGSDQLGIQGNYSNLVLSEYSLQNVETLVIMSGSNTRMGDTSGNLYSYNVTSVDANVARDATLTINYNGLLAGENVHFDGSAETDGKFMVYAGRGTDVLIGGARDDLFLFQDSGFTVADRIDGRDGIDQVGLRGNFTSGVVFEADTIKNVEVLVLISGNDNRYGPLTTGFGYNVTTVDANVAAGQNLDVNGNRLEAYERIVFDGSTETDGTFRLIGGKGADDFTGGACNDILYGALGADKLTGGGGADSYKYLGVADSTGVNFDQIVGFDCRVDRIDLPGELTGFSDVVGHGSLSGASFDADLGAALNAFLGAGEAALFTADAGDFAGRTFAVIDGNGQAGYQAGADYVIELVNPVVPINPNLDIFI